MDAEDWLRTVERELHTAQCNDREKVSYDPRQLRGVAQSWWESVTPGFWGTKTRART
jgi:hypothetical protein